MADVTLRPPTNAIQPGAYSAVDASALSGQGVTPSPPTVAVPGACLGGAPNTPMYFRDSQALRNVLRSGPAYDCARFVMSTGAQPVCVIRVGSGILQGTKSLAGASGNPVTLTSIDYGSWTNSIQVTVAANNLITITYVDRLGVTYNEVFNAGTSATAQQVVDLINGNTPGTGASRWVTASTNTGTMPLSTAAISALASGADGTLAGGDWTTGLTKLETEDVDVIVPATGDASVHAQVQTHCDNMSTTLARKERVGIYGAVAGESVAAQITRIASLRNKRSQLVYPGFVGFDDGGNLKTWDPFYMAGLIGGINAVLPDAATSLTHQRVPIINVEKLLSTVQGSDVDQLLTAGVTPIARATATGFWVVDSLSGYNTDDIFRDFHKIRSIDDIAVRARTRLEDKYVGGKSLLNQANAIKRDADALLNEFKGIGLCRDFAPSTVEQPPGNLKTYVITLPVMPVDTTKFIYLTVALQPSSTLQALPAVAPDANS